MNTNAGPGSVGQSGLTDHWSLTTDHSTAQRAPQSERAEQVKALLTARRVGHDADQLLLAIMTRWGGVHHFADALYKEFAAANEGSLIRQKVCEMVQKLVVNNTNHNITRQEDPSGLESEEIDREIQGFAGQIVEFLDARAAESGPDRRRPIYREADPPW